MNIKIILLVFCLCLFSKNSFAQISFVDSLNINLETEKNEIKRIDIQVRLAAAYRTLDLEKSKILSESLLNSSLKIGYIEGIAEGNYGLAYYYYYYLDFKKSKDFVDKAFTYFKQIENNKGIYKCYLYYAIFNFEVLDYYNAFKNYTEAYNITLLTKDIEGQSQVLYNIALIYYQLEDYSTALKNANESLLLAEKSKYKHMIASNYLLISHLNLDLKKNNQAKTNINKAISLYLEQDDKSNLINSYLQLACIKIYENEFKNALFICNKAEKVLSSMNVSDLTKAELNFVYAKAYFGLNNNNKALQYANSALNFNLKQEKHKEAAEVSKLIYNYYLSTTNTTNQFKYGNYYLDEISKYRKLQSKNLFFKNQIELESKKIETDKIKEEQKNQQVFLLLISSVIFLIAVIVIPLFYFKNKKINQSLDLLNESNILKSNFLSKVAHELNTPLNVIVGYSELLAKTNIIKKYNLLNQSIILQSSVLLNMTQGILSLNPYKQKVQEIKLIPANLSNLITEVYDNVKQINNSGLKLYLEIDSNLEQDFLVDKSRLQVILQNLLSSVLQFSKMKKIRLEVKILKQNKTKYLIAFSFIEFNNEKFLYHKSKDLRVIKGVSSTSPFLGLNLSFIDKNLDLMNSILIYKRWQDKIDVTTFNLELKLAQIETEIKVHNKEKLSDNKENTNKFKVLIVEDNDLNMILIKKMISTIYPNLNIIEAKNGALAIESFLKESPQLILMDIQMPIMNGFEAAAIIRDTHKSEVPIIAVSASVYADNEELFLKSKMNKYIEKPINSKILKLHLEEYIST